MATLGKLPIMRLPRHANMTELNHLGLNLAAQPYKFEGGIKQLFSAQNIYSDNPFTSAIMGINGEKTITSLEWEWSLRTEDGVPLVVTEDIEPSEKKLGEGRTTFRIKLDQNWYVPGDVITPKSGPKNFQCRIMEAPQRHGTGWVYVVRLKEDDFRGFLPREYTKPGTEWTKLFSEYEEAAVQSGSTQYGMPTSFKDYMSKFRKHYKVTDYAGQEVLAVALRNQKDGKMYNSWIPLAEANFWKEWAREKEISLIYNKSSVSIEGSTGRPVRSFAGLHEKIELDGHTHYYSNFSAKLLEDFLLDISYGRSTPGSGSRKMKVYTGEYGMILFHRAVMDNLNSKGWTILSTSFSPIQKTNSQYSSNAYSAGYQFTKFLAPNGIEVEVVHMPLYDDRSLNTQIDPITGYPVESMRFTFLDFTGTDGGSNIQIMKKKDSFRSWYVNGGYSPNAKGNAFAAHAGEYYEMHCTETYGLHLEDPTRCGTLIYKVDGLY